MSRAAAWIAIAIYLGTGSSVFGQDKTIHDHYGDPIPAGATVRFGTIRLRQSQGIEGVAFTPDGQHLITTGWENSVRFWNVETGQPTRRIKNSGMSFAAVVSPDGTRLASVGEGRARLWNLADNRAIFESESTGDRNYSIAFSPDGFVCATSGDDAIVHLWDSSTGDELLRLFLDDVSHDARPVAFSPNGRFLAGGSEKGIRVWDLYDGKEVTNIGFPKNAELVSLAFLNDSTLISSGSVLVRGPDGKYTSPSKVQQWQVPSGTRQLDYALDEEELTGGDSMALSHDRSRMATLHHRKVIIWNTKSHHPTRTIALNENYFFGGRTHGIALSPDAKLVAAKSGSHKAFVWSLETGEEVFPQNDTHHGAVLSIDTSSDGAQMVTSCAEGSTILWNATNGRFQRHLHRIKGWARDLALFPDQDRVAICGEFHDRDSDNPGFKGKLAVVRISDGKLLKSWTLPDRGMQLAISPNGKFLAVGIGLDPIFDNEGGHLGIQIYDMQSDEQIADLKGFTSEIKEIWFEDDSSTLWATSGIQATHWDIEKQEQIAQHGLEFDSMNLQQGALRLSSNLCFAAGTVGNGFPEETQGRIICRELNGGESRWKTEFEEHTPTLVHVSPDGSLLAVSLRPEWKSKAEAHLKIYRAASGEELKSFRLSDGRIRSLKFAADQKTLFSGMDRGDILAWNITDVHKH